jgi:hypothetical protein
VTGTRQLVGCEVMLDLRCLSVDMRQSQRHPRHGQTRVLSRLSAIHPVPVLPDCKHTTLDACTALGESNAPAAQCLSCTMSVLEPAQTGHGRDRAFSGPCRPCLEFAGIVYLGHAAERSFYLLST